MFLTTQDSPALTFSDCDSLGNLYWISYRLFSRRFSVSVIVKKCFCFCHSEALNALNLTALSDRRAHLCQVYIDRLRNENHPLHFMLPKQEEVVHNYNLRSGISRSTRPTCGTKRTQEFVTHKYT